MIICFLNIEMNNIQPERSKTYIGPVTDSRIWADFPVRDDDVVVITPPKCGTTWIRSMVLTLIFGKTGMDVIVNEVSPWLDCGFRDQSKISNILDEQTHRRCIKTHTPFDGITFSPDCTYIAVYRHPMDAYISMRKHMENLKIKINGSGYHYPEDVRGGFRNFVEYDDAQFGTDLMSVASIVYHYKSVKQWAHLPNVHLFHYADMSRNLGREMNRLSGILGHEYPQELMDEFVEANRFNIMKSNVARHVAPKESTIFKDDAEFFSSGTNNKWEKYLSTGDTASYDSRIVQLLPARDISWLQWGNTEANPA